MDPTMSRFSARTLAPWQEVTYGFLNSVGLALWLEQITGDRPAYRSLAQVREWLKTAGTGDVIYIEADDYTLVERDRADIEIRCNRPADV